MEWEKMQPPPPPKESHTIVSQQRAKKVVSDSQALVDFAIRLVMFFGGKSNYRGIVINPANKKGFWGEL